MEELNTPIYYGEAEAKQTAASGGNISFNIETASGTRLLLYFIHVQLSSTSADRRIDITIKNSSNTTVSYLSLDTSFGSTAWMTLPSQGSPATNAYNVNNLQPIPVNNGDKLNITLSSSVAQNENMKIYVRGYIKGKIPSMTSTGCGGTISISNTIQQIK